MLWASHPKIEKKNDLKRSKISRDEEKAVISQLWFDSGLDGTKLKIHNF